jgi:gliding motility-associated-like protein
VTDVPKPEINLGPDMGICNVDFVTLKAGDGTHFRWNTGDTTPFLNVYKKGIYRIVVRKNNCSASDEIEIWEGCDIDFYIPNAFTPSYDGLNEVFSVKGEHIEQVDLTIVDRWGEIIYQGIGLADEVGWDGTYKNTMCGEGVYFYLIKISGKYRGISRTKYFKGSITLLR